ncbi:pleckstrin homology domain-containing family B member 2 isoform X1 [Austrofundulus limnaeus]|uniref:Pleckstrin homology domain-containing family B member 2 isoform X1 n=1 Tax=Austrofundulus limnaeus TaxID=52670 RepID=A0A2I4DC74_AUSLI|nr:PREDICTED: pleckstrin homology domain-containing family B member 2 isoform X1 [Austrofundulus limnaeus]
MLWVRVRVTVWVTLRVMVRVRVRVTVRVRVYVNVRVRVRHGAGHVACHVVGQGASRCGSGCMSMCGSGCVSRCGSRLGTLTLLSPVLKLRLFLLSSSELSPPQGRTRDALFQIVCRDGRVVSLCADGADDALAWTLALQDARINTVGFAQEVVASAPPPYSEHVHPQVYSPGPYGDYSASPAHPTQIVYSADGQPYAVAHPYPYQYPYQHQHQYQGGYVSPGVNHVVIQERQRDSGGDMALGMLAGAATGLALGSFFSVF